MLISAASLSSQLNMVPKRLSLLQITYDLPDEKVAKYPLDKRDQSKLLIYKNGEISEDIYLRIADYLPGDSFLVFNNTKVVEARIKFKKATGTVIEVFCLEPDGAYRDISIAMQQKQTVRWKCLVGGAKKWKAGMILTKEMLTDSGPFRLQAKKLSNKDDHFIVEFTWHRPELSFAEVLHLAGDVPLPPYLKRNAETVDKERYQTVYAKQDGSVAAPTAGLHFTERIFDSLQKKGIETGFVTLHVGAGTFKPIADTIEEHEMHSEFIEVSAAFIEQLIKNISKKIVCVGTTSVRTVESLYWLGVKVYNNKNIAPQDLFLKQWESYEMKNDLSAESALQNLLDWMKNRSLSTLYTQTQMIITPGYPVKIADAIVTNFHQPKSTLLLLIGAFVFDDWKKIYAYALSHNFRFLSYGDGSLLWKTAVH